MPRHEVATPPVERSRATKWLVAVGSLALFAAVAWIDSLTAKELTFTVLYLVPIAIAVWFVGPGFSLALCFLAAVTSFVLELRDGIVPTVAVWNEGVRLSIYLLFHSLLRYFREHRHGAPGPTRIRRWIAVAAVVPMVALAGAGVFRATPAEEWLRAMTAPTKPEPVAERDPFAELALLVGEATRASRPLLLGSRDPNGPTCVSVPRAGDAKDGLPSLKGDLDGGPGTSLAVLHSLDRREIQSPLGDFKWHQTRLRRFLENNIARGVAADGLAQQAAAQAREFLATANTWTAVPAEVTAINFTGHDDWPSYCVTSLGLAIGRKDLAEARTWARELAAATLWMDDLLRWRSFLYQDFLTALDFQARCESLFDSAESRPEKYDPESTPSRFPAGVLGLNGRNNYYEVERQAERLFSMPADRLAELEHNGHRTPGSAWVPPEERDAFLQLRSVLSPDNQRTWDLAGESPYEHAFLVNMLFRARSVGTLHDLQTVLKACDAHNPRADVGALMDVLMYRGHSFAGIEWADRFQPQLTAAAAKIAPGQTDLAAARAAWQWTNQFYRPVNYGLTLTLRDALDQRKLDCVRATDMIATIYRDAGRGRMGNVRWCSESSGHSLAAYLGPDDPRSKPLVLDGLMPPGEPEVWPDCYFHGHKWPPELDSNRPPYAMELYTRGIDGYVWTQGYIVRGPNAGLLMTAAIPFTRQFPADSTRKVFDTTEPK
jgi:hypothetical protein